MRKRRAGALLAVGIVVALLPTTQLTRSLPPVRFASSIGGGSITVPGTPPALPWPKTGEGAVSVPTSGFTEQSCPEAVVPVASLTKLMTAYLVLRDHPLAEHQNGPTLTMTAEDVSDYDQDTNDDESNITVAMGERLTERQLIEGLLVHSANNFADTLGRWDAGTDSAFVQHMNAAAHLVGMIGTHYVDDDGYEPGSVSTAADVLRLTAADMQYPVFAQVVAMPNVTLPLEGTVSNYVSEVGTDGVVGVKSGFTQQAMGCVVLAVERKVAGRTVEILAAVTGQTGFDALGTAGQAALKLADAVAQSMVAVPATAVGQSVGTLVSPWSSKPVRAVTAGSAVLLGTPGQVIRLVATDRPLSQAVGSGQEVATVVYGLGGQTVAVPVRAAAPIGSPPLFWRLFH